MDKRLAGLFGAAAALTAVGGAQAAQVQEPAASTAAGPASYAELLNPIPNAMAMLKADDAQRAQARGDEVQLAQFRYYHHHHHHHHHHQVYPPIRRYFGPRYHHHHHHHDHHHHHQYRRY